MKYPFALMGVFLGLVVGVRESSAADPRDDFSKIFSQMVEAAPEDYKSIRGEPNFLKNPDGGPMNWRCTLRLPEAEEAFIWGPRPNIPYYWLGMVILSAVNEGASEKAMESYTALAKKVRECLPEAWKGVETKEQEGARVITTFTREGNKSPARIQVMVWTLKKSSKVTLSFFNKP